MRLDWAILSNFAEIAPNGLHYALGSGWDTGNRPEFPASFGGALSIRVLFDRLEVGRQHSVEIHFSDEDGKPVVPPLIATASGGTVPPGWPIGWDIPLMFVINLQSIAIPRPGIYAIDILIDGQNLRKLPLRFLQEATMPPGIMPPRPPGAA